MASQDSPPRRPRLSLQIKAIAGGPNLRASRTVAAHVDVTSPTQFNTLSNVYATAIERSTPVEPVTAVNWKQSLRLNTQNVHVGRNIPTPHVSIGIQLPETPLTAQPLSPAVRMEMQLPSVMTSTPPLSAGPVDANDPRAFSFVREDTEPLTAINVPAVANPLIPRRSTAPVGFGSPPPYVRNRALHSILRNSPLPPATARTPISPRRQSLRLIEKEARRVGYLSPLESVIVNDQFTRSHMDFLSADVSPYAESPVAGKEVVLDSAMAYTGDETRDGGQTPGPFEEMRRRMAGLVTRTPVSPSGGVRKRRKEKKERSRKWVWTIGQDDGDDSEEIGGAMAAIRAAAQAGVGVKTAVATMTTSSSATSSAAAVISIRPPTKATSKVVPRLIVPARPAREVVEVTESPMDILTPSIETCSESQSIFEDMADVVMSDTGSVTEDELRDETDDEVCELALAPGEMDMDIITPTIVRKPVPRALRSVSRQSSVMSDLFNPETGSRRDTPVPSTLRGASEG